MFLMTDTAYDTKERFLKTQELGIRLVAEMNMRRNRRVENFRDNERYENAVFLSSRLKNLQKVNIIHLITRLR